MYQSHWSNPQRLETDSQVESKFHRSPNYTFGDHNKGSSKLRHPPGPLPGPGAYNSVGSNRLPTTASYRLFTGDDYFPRTTAHFRYHVGTEDSLPTADSADFQTTTSGKGTARKEGAAMKSPGRQREFTSMTSPLRSPRRSLGAKPGTFGTAKKLPDRALRRTYMSFAPGDARGPLERFQDEHTLGPGQYDALDPMVPTFMPLGKKTQSWKVRPGSPKDKGVAAMAHRSWTLNTNTNAAKMVNRNNGSPTRSAMSIHSIPGTTICPLPTSSRRRDAPDESHMGPGTYHREILLKKHQIPGPHIQLHGKLPSMWSPSSHCDPLNIHLSFTNNTEKTVPWHSTTINFDTKRKPRIPSPVTNKFLL